MRVVRYTRLKISIKHFYNESFKISLIMIKMKYTHIYCKACGFFLSLKTSPALLSIIITFSMTKVTQLSFNYT